jgi:hypothetical protein
MNAFARGRRIVLIAAAGLSFSACYDFDFPLDPAPRVPVDGRLLGSWRCLAMAEDDIDEPVMPLSISRGTEHVTRWRFAPASNETGEGAEEVGEYDVHGSTAKGGQFLSAREVKPDGSGDWSFVRYTFLLPDVLRLQVVDDKPFDDVEKDPAKLRKAVEKRRNDPAIYWDFLVCVRTKSPESPSPSPTPGL